MKTISALVLAAATFASLSAQALTLSDLNGSSAASAVAQRTIVVDASTRYVNVNQGDIVTFVNNGMSVTWVFDGIKQAIPLSTLFPANAALGNIEIYIAPASVS